MLRRIGFSILAIAAVAVGLIVGTLNSEKTTLDLLWFQLDWPLGLVLLCAFVTGLLLGLALIGLFQVVPLRMQLRKLRSMPAQSPMEGSRGDDA